MDEKLLKWIEKRRRERKKGPFGVDDSLFEFVTNPCHDEDYLKYQY